MGAMPAYRNAVLTVALIVATASPLSALAAPSPLVQPNGRLELDFGVGIGHVNRPERTGLGLNLELKYGLGGGSEIGLRTGVRNEDGRSTGADGYGRPYDRETFGTGYDTIANPELRLRTALTGAIALEGRMYLPFDGPFGFMFALPVVIASGGLRLDTGVYVPIVLDDRETLSWVSIPVQLWFIGGRAWDVGIISGARLVNHASNWEVPIGVGLDRTLSSLADLLLWFVFPDITYDGAANTFGGGVGLRLRI